MGKVLALLLIILWALVSVAGYLFLAEKTTGGKRQIADGQRYLEKGQLRSRRARLNGSLESQTCQRARRPTSKLKTTCSWS
jgi:hypothetical protein